MYSENREKNLHYLKKNSSWKKTRNICLNKI